jgi:hypothetical protein
MLLMFCGTDAYSQPPVKLYTVKNGRMMIHLDKEMREAALDSFIIQFDLGNLALKQFIRSGFKDSLKKFGWDIESNTSAGILISKPLLSFDKLNNPAERIIFSENDIIAERFPAISGGVIYGHNRPKNKRPFAVVDSIVTFFMRGKGNATNVFLAGSFNNWRPDALPMQKTDSGWIATVKIGKGKYWYKFVVDGNWQVDDDNALRENDGLGNMNSVYFKTNVVFQLKDYQNARNVYLAGSFNNWKPKELEMIKTPQGWELPMYLADGTHTYRFIVDGKWMIDPANEDQVPNEFNETNSVLRIGIPVLFTINGNLQLPEVQLAGSFNNWRRNELFMKKTAEGWELPYNLGPGNYEYRFASKGKWISDPQPPLIIKPNYTFRLKGFPDAKTVYLAGTFNNWSSNGYQMKREGDEWVFTVHLSEGKHQYKFVVDNNWIRDPNNPLWEQNDSGNSIVWYGR